MNTTALIFLLLLFILLIWAFRFLRKSSGVLFEDINFQDTDAKGEIFYSEKYGICGKPDYVVEEKSKLIPVELKPLSSKVNDSQIAQVLTYCLLIEDVFKKKVPHAIIRNKTGIHKISFTDEKRKYIKGVVKAVRKSYELNLNRSHNNPLICKYCHFNEICDQKLINAN